MAAGAGLDTNFTGKWEDASGTVLTITGSTITGSDGRSMKLVFEGEDTCKFQRGKNVYTGKLGDDGNSLHWPGGTVWWRHGVSRESFDSKRPRLTLGQALSIQKELHAGFSDPEFQSKLKDLERVHSASPGIFLNERSKLFLTVQGPVLLKHNFEASQKGVVDMLDAGARFNSNSEYVQNRDRLNKLLGMVDLNCGRRVTVNHLFDEGELKVDLPRSATFSDLKKALAALAGTDDIVTKGLLIRKEDDGALAPYRDSDMVGGTQEVTLLRASLPAQQEQQQPEN